MEPQPSHQAGGSGSSSGPKHTGPSGGRPSRTSRPPSKPGQGRGGSGRGRHFSSRGGRPSHPPRRGKSRVEHQAPSARKQIAATIPPPADDTVRIIPLGGVEEIGRNMTAVEFGNDIFILDCGFAFSEEDTPGIDYILPNTGYLEERRDKIRGLLISHGHLDHIGGIPYIVDRIGNPTIYTRKLTGMMIKKRQE